MRPFQGNLVSGTWKSYTRTNQGTVDVTVHIYFGK